MNNKMTWPLLAFLIAINWVQPMSIDMYLPAVHQVQHYFHATTIQVESTLSMFLLGLGFGQLIYGALSDYFGRKIVFFLGGFFYCAVSIACIHTVSIDSLIVLRFFQAFSVGVFVNTANAIVRDVCASARETSIYLGILNGTLAVSPGVAPILGLALVRNYHWFGVFMCLTLLAGLCMGCSLLIPETNKMPGYKQSRSFLRVLGSYIDFFRYRHCCGYSIIYGLGFSSFIAYVTASSWLWLDVLHQSVHAYTYYFALNAIAFAFGGFTTAFLARAGVHTHSLVRIALSCILFAGLLLFYSFYQYAHHMMISLPWVVVSVFILSFGVTMTIVSSMTKILLPFPNQAAQVTAFAQCISLMICALVGYLTAHITQVLLLGLPLLIIIVSLFALLVLALMDRLTHEDHVAEFAAVS